MKTEEWLTSFAEEFPETSEVHVELMNAVELINCLRDMVDNADLLRKLAEDELQEMQEARTHE